ncbi:uncharacterized protein N7515_010074 [Penicillium bovifimosum]|uniref:Uncharacterized protein n=1 Tax=Penicillium bovifimosum TaxID=126998 RepID=A0A9W9GI53_9EURO|nr:uncharacterized protein N7515_010074 [Penicillium bovifimosum]KAJ5120686.1 hypothetical protein N7515_010074 [Penicillium bovifimosum]
MGQQTTLFHSVPPHDQNMRDLRFDPFATMHIIESYAHSEMTRRGVTRSRPTASCYARSGFQDDLLMGWAIKITPRCLHWPSPTYLEPTYEVPSQKVFFPLGTVPPEPRTDLPRIVRFSPTYSRGNEELVDVLYPDKHEGE